jgi:hypothetical protein
MDAKYRGHILAIHPDKLRRTRQASQDEIESEGHVIYVRVNNELRAKRASILTASKDPSAFSKTTRYKDGTNGNQ